MRLTEIIKVNGKEYVNIKGTKSVYANAERKGAPASNAIVRLAAYEDAEEQSRMPRWIPVTEEPPLKVGDDGYNGYLVYANGYYQVADYAIDKYDNVPYFHVDGEIEPDVTHYMPLPAPPKEEA